MWTKNLPTKITILLWKHLILYFSFILKYSLKNQWVFFYWIWIITRWADTGRVPPESGVIVSAVEFPEGFLTVNIELTDVVVTIAVPIICEVPVARPKTVYSKSAPFKVNISCPAITHNMFQFVLN